MWMFWCCALIYQPSLRICAHCDGKDSTVLLWRDNDDDGGGSGGGDGAQVHLSNKLRKSAREENKIE